jgi:hypothetical protein
MTSCMHRVVAMAIFALTLLLAPGGASAKVGDSCGAIIGNVLCGKGEFCQHPVGQCAGFLPGACAAKPHFCSRIYRAVLRLQRQDLRQRLRAHERRRLQAARRQVREREIAAANVARPR